MTDPDGEPIDVITPVMRTKGCRPGNFCGDCANCSHPDL